MSAQRLRAHVAHEHLRRLGVVPQEAEGRADDDEAKDDQELLILQEGDDAIGDEGRSRN
jgi:hypothetical protein